LALSDDAQWPPRRVQGFCANDTVTTLTLLVSRIKNDLALPSSRNMIFTAWKGDCYYSRRYLAGLLHKIAEGKVPVPTEPVPFQQLAADTLAWLKTEGEQFEHVIGDEADPKDDTEPQYQHTIAKRRPIKDKLIYPRGLRGEAQGGS
jgi:hypothetical protein